jgi:hypothetical protein
VHQKALTKEQKYVEKLREAEARHAEAKAEEQRELAELNVRRSKLAEMEEIAATKKTVIAKLQAKVSLAIGNPRPLSKKRFCLRWLMCCFVFRNVFSTRRTGPLVDSPSPVLRPVQPVHPSPRRPAAPSLRPRNPTWLLTTPFLPRQKVESARGTFRPSPLPPLPELLKVIEGTSSVLRVIKDSLLTRNKAAARISRSKAVRISRVKATPHCNSLDTAALRKASRSRSFHQVSSSSSSSSSNRTASAALEAFVVDHSDFTMGRECA